METRDVCVNDDNFDHREALEAAIDKGKFLLKSLFRNTYGLLVTLTLDGCLCLVYKNKIRSFVVAIFPKPISLTLSQIPANLQKRPSEDRQEY
jgi:hypothetical protein